MKYSVTVTLEQPLPVEYTRDSVTGLLSETAEPYVFITLWDTENEVLYNEREPVVSDDGLTYTFENVGGFAPGSYGATHALMFEVVPGKHEVVELDISNINVRIAFEQVD